MARKAYRTAVFVSSKFITMGSIWRGLRHQGYFERFVKPGKPDGPDDEDALKKAVEKIGYMVLWGTCDMSHHFGIAITIEGNGFLAEYFVPWSHVCGIARAKQGELSKRIGFTVE